MSKSSNQKMKILYLLKILTERTDEEHPMTMPQLISALGQYGISAERKSIYDDIECLSVYGVDVIKSAGSGYFIGSRDFELPELKLLVDSVQASRFITHKKSLELISKLERLTSAYNAGKLRRQVFVMNRVKTLNEGIYYAVDTIYEAISKNKQISFHYFEWTPEGKKSFRKNGELYIETPVSLSWDDENYYLIAYKEKYSGFTHYRVDKMTDITILDEERILPDKSFDPAEYSKKIFGMFGGEETAVDVKFENSLAGVVIDRFGSEAVMLKSDENHFTAKIKVAISPQFFGWLAGLGTKAEIVSPRNVRDDMRRHIEGISELYRN
ncbi:MAG: WYL domain-containing protein [Clostridia bacterium]|nr:WYL domain-containing protein [Clostridia bacterium]